MSTADVGALSERLMRSMAGVIVGKSEQLAAVAACLLARGHLLLEDLPGTGKTMLARSLARSIDGVFRRVQATPDLLPNDVTGVNVFDPRATDFAFRPGPLFCNVLLADEINRATPRTQPALLEAMAERQVTIDGESRPLEDPFMVIATQKSGRVRRHVPASGGAARSVSHDVAPGIFLQRRRVRFGAGHPCHPPHRGGRGGGVPR